MTQPERPEQAAARAQGSAALIWYENEAVGVTGHEELQLQAWSSYIISAARAGEV